jgi:hypothetical protein
MAARILDCSLADYLGDNVTDGLTLNASIANILLTQSPLHAHAAHPKLGGGTGEEASPEQDLGSLLHRLLLGAGPEVVEVPHDDWRTKAAKEAREEARSRGALPVLEHKLAQADYVARMLSGRLRERGILLDGDSEVKVTWEEPIPQGPAEPWGTDVACRGMIDHLGRDRSLILDLKTGATANPAVIARQVLDRGWHVQAAAYTSAVEKLHPELVGRVECLFLCCEVKAPFAVSVCRLGNALTQLGSLQWQRACRIWAECVSLDRWPAYSDEIVTLEAPAWAVQQLETEVLNGD